VAGSRKLQLIASKWLQGHFQPVRYRSRTFAKGFAIVRRGCPHGCRQHRS